MVTLTNTPNLAALGLTEAQLAVVRGALDVHFFDDGDTIDRCDNVHAASLLAMVMSNISEESFCEGWMVGLGEDLRGLVAKHGRSGPVVERGMSQVTASDRDTLATLAALAGGWPEWDEPGTPFILLPLEAP